MKQALTSFVALVLAFSLTACSQNIDSDSSDIPGSSQTSSSSDTSRPPVSSAEPQSREQSSSPASSQEVLDTTPLKFPEGKGLTITLPEPVQPYNPEVKVVPLVGNALLYRFHLEGELKFIDEKGNPMDLPPKAVRYQINSNCYLLFDSDRNMALMRFDGTVLTDFSYKALDGEDIIYCPAAGQYVKVWKTVNGKNKCGVIDLVTGSELLPCEYDEIDLYNRAIHAIKDKISLLFDYKGNLIYDFKEEVGFDSSFIQSAYSKYYFDNENGKIVTLGEMIIDQYSKTYNILILNNKMTITDKQWNPVYTLPDRHATLFQASHNEYIIFGYAKEIIVVSKGKDIIKFPYSFKDLEIEKYTTFYDLFEKIEYKDNKLIFYRKNKPSDRKFYNRFTMDRTGKIIKKEYNLRNTTVDEDNIAYQYPNRHALLDDNGKELIPYSQYALRKRGNFILAELEDELTNTYKVKIYNTEGRLLLDDVYDIPSFLVLSNGAVVVYTSSSNCYLLFPDGKLTSIANPPKVEAKYTGG